jgi:hypothetical protein
MRDADDRRRVLVEARPAGIRRIEPLYRSLAQAMGRLHARYDDRQLTLVMEYLTEAADLGAAHVASLQGQPRLRRATSVRTPASSRPVRRARRPASRPMSQR